MSLESEVQGEADDIVYPSALTFGLVHLSCLAAIWTGVTWRALGICVALYWIRIFAIGAGYHRYFSHRAYSTSRVFQFILGYMSQTTAQNSVLWWAGKHRHHHLHSDTVHDAHSAQRKGFLYSHILWIFDRKHHETDLVKMSDFACYPELRWLAKYEYVPAISVAVICFLLAGWPGLVVGFLWSTVLVYHSTFCINSLAHIHGKKRYVTGDSSRNNWILAVFTMGEGWHNNHHAYQSSVRQGFRWWEIDPTYYILWTLSKLGIVWDLKTPPKSVLMNEQRLGSRVIDRAAEQLAIRFNPDAIAQCITTAVHGPDLAALQERLARARHSTAEALAGLHLPGMPSREEIVASARAMFAKTPSLDDIVDRAHAMLLAAVSARIAGPAAKPA